MAIQEIGEKETKNRRMGGKSLELAPGTSHCFKFKVFNTVDH